MKNSRIIEVSILPATNTLPTRIKVHCKWFNEKIILHPNSKYESIKDQVIAHLDTVKGIETSAYGYDEVSKKHILLTDSFSNIK